ncbi:hypothetical protein QQX98_011392 [Neonectria punicea]|uniref:Uncharacterized protein n=1 Tax=Neonectria punicea TaxID=979145 RepID=A0ABR1GLU2_9HYPO
MTKDQKNEQEKEFSIQPIKESGDSKVGAFNAHPGPAIPKEMPQEEGTKEERKAQMEALNKK